MIALGVTLRTHTAHDANTFFDIVYETSSLVYDRPVDDSMTKRVNILYVFDVAAERANSYYKAVINTGGIGYYYFTVDAGVNGNGSSVKIIPCTLCTLFVVRQLSSRFKVGVG